MPKCYQLVGVPGSGKSTWYSNQDWMQDMVYISTDKFVEEHARSIGKTYSEVFNDYMPTAIKLMMIEVNQAAAEQRDIVWDQTSTTWASRRRKFGSLPFYEHIAVVFETPSRIELKKRLASRPGKEIPDSVMEGMLSGFEMPTEEEGFKEIWYAST